MKKINKKHPLLSDFFNSEYERGKADAIKESSWSEEDEYLLYETSQHLEELIRIDKAKHCACDVQYYQRDIDWLKSLKDRYTWKPSDEQMEALADALSLAKNCGEERAFDLRTLYEQLQKIKENEL